MTCRDGKAGRAAYLALAGMMLFGTMCEALAACENYRPEDVCKKSPDYDPKMKKWYTCRWANEFDPAICKRDIVWDGYNAMRIFAEFGDRTTDVLALQLLLNANGFKVETDNKFGLETLKALTEFQQKNNLPKTGTDQIVDKKTLDALVTKKK